MLPIPNAKHFASNSKFVSLLGAYRASGGIAPGDVLGRLFEEHHRGYFVSLARLLVNGQLFAFAWRQSLWIPMFQFHSEDLSIKTAAQKVRAELPATADGGSLDTWFAGPNDQHDGQRPVDLLDSQLLAVMDAARRGSIRNHVRFRACLAHPRHNLFRGRRGVKASRPHSSRYGPQRGLTLVIDSQHLPVVRCERGVCEPGRQHR